MGSGEAGALNLGQALIHLVHMALNIDYARFTISTQGGSVVFI